VYEAHVSCYFEGFGRNLGELEIVYLIGEACLPLSRLPENAWARMAH